MRGAALVVVVEQQHDALSVCGHCLLFSGAYKGCCWCHVNKYIGLATLVKSMQIMGWREGEGSCSGSSCGTAA